MFIYYDNILAVVAIKMVELPIFKCVRCLHTWYPRTPKPVVCPRCKSPYWDKPRLKTHKKVIPDSEKEVQDVIKNVF